MIELVHGDPSRIGEAEQMTFIESCIYHGYKKQYKE